MPTDDATKAAHAVDNCACWGAPLLLLLAIPLFWSGTALGTMGHDRAASNEPATPAPAKEDTPA